MERGEAQCVQVDLRHHGPKTRVTRCRGVQAQEWRRAPRLSASQSAEIGLGSGYGWLREGQS